MSTPAVAYLRVSGKSQIEGDGFPRQQSAIDRAAEKAGFVICYTFKDEGVSGTKKHDDRPVFMEMVNFVHDTPGLRTVFVENLTRLAREYTVQDGILLFLASKGIDLISADTGENVTEAVRNDPMKKALIQMQAVFSELEKNNLVSKLRKARERKKAETGRCDGQKPFGTLPGEAEALDLMIQMRDHAYPVRRIADEMNQTTHRTRNGRPWHYASVAKILARHTP